MDWKQALGLMGGALIVVSFIPQIGKLYKLKSAREISLPFTLLQLCGGFMWLAYGLVLSLPAVIITNIASIFLVSLIVFAKIRYGR